jgi:GAF domain-containing protein/HAMP domain-containing protein
MPDDFSTAQSTLTEQEETIFIQSLGKENIAGYTLLRDVHGEPILVMRVDMPRDIYGQGQTSLSYFAWSLLIVGLIFGLLALLLLERLVLSRLARISEAISDISASGDLSARVVVTGKDELSNLANEINNMLEALQVSDIQLAERGRDLARRVRHLKATAEVAQYTTAVLDPQELLSRVVTMIGERFGFYHVAIFLLDPAGEWAVLQAASSEGGRQLLARKYRMRVGREGIVGHVTNWGDPRIVPDVEADTMFSAVPELPDTRSEMVWPLRARGKIIGALDVQSKELQAFDKDDVAVLHTLADQIAVALSNARLFQQLQESLDRQQRTFGELSSRAWIDTLQSQSGMGYRYTRGSITPLTGLPRSEQSAPEASVEMQHSEGEQALPQLAIPLRVREYEIGTINVHKSADAGDWTPEEMAMLETMTDQLGVALESARLYQDAQRRAARERLVSDVTARMRETLDVNTVLQTAVREIRQVLGLHDVTIRLGESVERPRRATRKPDEEVRS